MTSNTETFPADIDLFEPNKSHRRLKNDAVRNINSKMSTQPNYSRYWLIFQFLVT